MASQYSDTAFQHAAADLCHYGKLMYDRNWSPATSSNYSIRLNDTCCALTSSGKHKGELTEADILVVDWQGQALSAGKPSAETGLHTQLYRRDAQIGAVLHTHSPVAVLLSQIWPNHTLTLHGWELQKALSGETTHLGHIHIPIFDNTQDIDQLAHEVEQHMQLHGQGHAYLIRGHGIYTWGSDIHTCFRHLEALDHLLQYELQRRQLGLAPITE